MSEMNAHQQEALWIAYDGRPASRDGFRASGIRMQTVTALERRGLLVRWDYANGPHWDLSTEGHAALKEIMK